MSDLFDALQNPIIFGFTYGYSSAAGSSITVVTGKAIKVTPSGKITLEIVSRRNYLYGKEYEKTWGGDSKLVHIHPCHLFPVMSKENLAGTYHDFGSSQGSKATDSTWMSLRGCKTDKLERGMKLYFLTPAKPKPEVDHHKTDYGTRPGDLHPCYD